MRYRKDHTFRKLAAVVLIAAALGVALIIFRGSDNPEGRERPIYGTATDTGFVVVDEEVGVFEDPTEGDVVTLPPLPEQQPAPTPEPVTEEARSRAVASIPRYETALEDKRQDPLLLNNYGWSLHLAGRYQDAERVLRDVIRIAPNRAIAYANLGESLWKQGKNEEAAAMYRRFLAMNTDPRRERIAEAKVAAISGRE